MKGKSLIAQILTIIIIVIGGLGAVFTPTQMAIAGIISAGATIILKTFFPSGTLVSGWDVLLWAMNIGAVILQITTMIGEVAWISPTILLTMTALINTIILVIANQSYGLMKTK